MAKDNVKDLAAAMVASIEEQALENTRAEMLERHEAAKPLQAEIKRLKRELAIADADREDTEAEMIGVVKSREDALKKLSAIEAKEAASATKCASETDRREAAESHAEKADKELKASLAGRAKAEAELKAIAETLAGVRRQMESERKARSVPVKVDVAPAGWTAIVRRDGLGNMTYVDLEQKNG